MDHTGFFRALAEGGAEALFTEPAAYRGWARRREALRTASAEELLRVNPLYIPRNVHLDAALRAAHLGDPAPVREMLEAVRDPFTRRPGLAHLEGPGDGGEHFLTFCGT